MQKWLAGLLLAGFLTPLSAKPLLVPEIGAALRTQAFYRCDGGKTLSVVYFNTHNGQSFALLPFNGVSRLLVSTLSASGVRYAADHIIWWTKGTEGNLYDLRKGDNAPALRTNCKVVPHTPGHARLPAARLSPVTRTQLP